MPKIPPATVKVEADIGPDLRALLDGAVALRLLRRITPRIIDSSWAIGPQPAIVTLFGMRIDPDERRLLERLRAEG